MSQIRSGSEKSGTLIVYGAQRCCQQYADGLQNTHCAVQLKDCFKRECKTSKIFDFNVIRKRLKNDEQKSGFWKQREDALNVRIWVLVALMPLCTIVRGLPSNRRLG
jgi:hypothetical protein